MKRALELYDILRRAEAEGRPWERTVVSGRDALRIRRPDGTETHFLSQEELARLDVLLEDGPPRLEGRGLQAFVWDASRFAFSTMDGAVEVSIDAEPPGPEGEQVEALVQVYRRFRQAQTRVTLEVAQRLLPYAATWGAPVEAGSLAARLELQSVTLVPGSASVHVFMSAGDSFWGHSVEVWLDEADHVVEAAIAG